MRLGQGNGGGVDAGSEEQHEDKAKQGYENVWTTSLSVTSLNLAKKILQNFGCIPYVCVRVSILTPKKKCMLCGALFHYDTHAVIYTVNLLFSFHCHAVPIVIMRLPHLLDAAT